MSVIVAHHENTRAEALIQRASCCAASEGFIGEGNRRAEMRDISLSRRCLYARLTLAVCFFAAAAKSIADARA